MVGDQGPDVVADMVDGKYHRCVDVAQAFPYTQVYGIDLEQP